MKNAPDKRTEGSAVSKRPNFNPTASLFPKLDSHSGISQYPTSGETLPTVTGQCAQVLELIRKHGPLLSFVLTADYAIPEAAARVHDLRTKGFNIVTQIQKEVVFRGRARRNAAMYSIGIPEWLAPGSRQTGSIDAALAGLIAFGVVCAGLLVMVV